MSERKWILVPLLVMLPACSLLQGVALPGPTAVAATNPAPWSSPQAPVDPADACPSPDAATTLYLSRENGFCMLVPLEIEINPDPLQPEEVIFLQGPRETLGPKQQEGAAVWMQVAQNGPADGLDSAGYAQRWVELYAMPDGSSTPEPGTIGGRPATILKDLPGMIRLQSAFIVADGVKYQITLAPQPGDVPELDAAAIQLWDTVVRSIVFFPRENPAPAVRAQDVCPAAAGETFAYRNDRLGMCSLLPADFAVRPDIPDMFVGGPVIGTDKDFGEVRTSIAFGTFGHAAGNSPMDMLQERMDFIDPGSIVETSIGGYPAVVFKDVNGAWPSRQAFVVVNGDAYTILGQPWDPERFPDGIPHLDRVWETTVGNLRFFDPWR